VRVLAVVIAIARAGGRAVLRWKFGSRTGQEGGCVSDERAAEPRFRLFTARDDDDGRRAAQSVRPAGD